MIWKIMQAMAWLVVMAAISAGSYLFAVGGKDSYMCQTARFLKANAPVLPLSGGMCEIAEAKDPRTVPPPTAPTAVEDTIYFRADSKSVEYPNKATVKILAGCAFDLAEVETKSYTYITWVNSDERSHSLIMEKVEGEGTESFKIPPMSILPGGSSKMFLNQTGVFSYRCSEQPEPVGKLTVK